MPPNLVVIDEVEILQCGDDIFFLDTSDFTDLIDGDLWPLPTLRLQPHQDLQDGLGPVTSVR